MADNCVEKMSSKEKFLGAIEAMELAIPCLGDEMWSPEGQQARNRLIYLCHKVADKYAGAGYVKPLKVRRMICGLIGRPRCEKACRHKEPHDAGTDCAYCVPVEK